MNHPLPSNTDHGWTPKQFLLWIVLALLKLSVVRLQTQDTTEGLLNLFEVIGRERPCRLS